METKLPIEGVDYKVWFQPFPGRTVREDGTREFMLKLTESQRRGIIKGFRALTANDSLSGSRLQIQYVANCKITDTGNLYCSRFFPGPLLNPLLFNNEPLSTIGIFTVRSPISPLYIMIPSQFQKEPYKYLLLLRKDVGSAEYYIIVIQDKREYAGILTSFQWLDIDPNKLIIRIEDQNGFPVDLSN